MTTMPNDEWFRLLASWSKELLSATDRIHYLIGNRHQPTKGSYREALLRRLLRRVLPDRFRVSTGFIYRWNEPPTRQIDVLIWDAQQHSALLEEGDLAILTADAVAAIIEVKSTLTTSDLRDALDLLHPVCWVNWRYTSETSLTGLSQQVPDVPFRAVFAYNYQHTDVSATVAFVFSELASFYRQRFGDDAKRALTHSGNNLKWINMLDSICIADGPQIEQTHVTIDCDDGGSYDAPGFVAYAGHPTGESIAVGRFCMYLLWSLTGWAGGEAARVTLRAPAPTTLPGICCFGQFPGTPQRLRLWGADVPPETLWCPEPPLWSLASVVSHGQSTEGA
jgi:hypothetical protein